MDMLVTLEMNGIFQDKRCKFETILKFVHLILLPPEAINNSNLVEFSKMVGAEEGGESLLLEFISGHNFLMLLSGCCYFWNFTVFSPC